MTSRVRRSSWQIQLAAIRALFWREVQTRFGSYDLRLGYLWVILSPGLQILFMVLLFSFIKVRVVPHMEYALFLVAGMIPWMMFANCATRSLGAVSANKGLFNYRPVLPIDAVIARSALEGLLYFNVFIVFLAGLWWLGYDISLSNIPLLCMSWICLWLFSVGVALIMTVIGHWSDEVANFIRIFIRIMYFTSGILYSLHVLPVEYLKYVLWNPVPHVLEYMRYAVAPNYPIDHVSYPYFLQSMLIVIFLGLLLYRANERNMMTTQ
ncbi:MAG: ABC transporter permease [Pseudomonadota bacterium]|nr:ABC transporter permease [Pseudomonadota bacterium]